MKEKINQLLNLVLDAGEKCKPKGISLVFNATMYVNKIEVYAILDNEHIFSEYIYTDLDSHSIDDLITKTKQFIESI